MIVHFSKHLNRYIIVDETTGEIIDDAQGYGFKTKQGAYKALYYKQNYDKIYEESKLITDWWNNHQELHLNIEDDIFYYTCKCNEDWTTKDIKEYLNRIDEFADAPFDSYKMYKYYYSSYETIKKHKNKKKQK